MGVEDEVVEIKMTGQQCHEHEIEYHKISHIKLAFSILPVGPSSDLVKHINLDNLDHKDKN